MDTNLPCAASQDVSSNCVRPRESVSTPLPSSPSTSPVSSASFVPQHQSSYDSDSGESRHSVDDYLAAVTLASCFQREN